MKKVLIADRFHPAALAALQADSNLIVEHQIGFSISKGSEADYLIVRSGQKISKAIVSVFPNLKAIITATAGFDHLDLELSDELSQGIWYCPDAHTQGVVELTYSLLFSVLKKFKDHTTYQQQDPTNNWWKNRQILGTELGKKTFGLIGIGRIGSRVARIADAFGANVIAYDPYQPDLQFEIARAQRRGLIEILKESDILSLHVPLTQQTKHMINTVTLKEMSPDAILINTSRGAVIREQDLIQTLNLGYLGGCGLDVFEREPLSQDSILRRINRVILTPHIGSSTNESFLKVSQHAADAVLRLSTQDTPRKAQPLPPKQSWYQSAQIKIGKN